MWVMTQKEPNFVEVFDVAERVMLVIVLVLKHSAFRLRRIVKTEEIMMSHLSH